MKFVSLFLAIIVVVLSVAPCCALEGADSCAHETTQKEKHVCDGQSDDSCKDCSPFYLCGTCIGFTFTTQQAVTFAIPIKPVKHNTAYITAGLPLIALSIWQPPKLY
ncbi:MULTISPECIES: DUF6660 family protein [Olivibacter]|uniref:DUF6660 family protein n=2 Tax=Olivibacter TaxID=376469 RepID=A0ABV6HSV2_9SPHI|nr:MULTISPECIES: DUF6660 family protein [Olivibacter]MDX3917439.1 hypothetical protein [Pseudosphingobacterium sp.]QEL03942.1 hypothetical protein FKG96_24945 [Olivibacter sp. LS-1]